LIPLRARRILAALLAGAGLAALLAGAAAQDLPFGDSVRMAGRFWRAGPRGRLLNSPGFARDAAFVADALRGAAAWPPGDDVLLSAGPALPPGRRERLRRAAAYVLSPRRVRVVAGTGDEARLSRAGTGDAPR